MGEGKIQLGENQEEITRKGNPKKPQGEEGKQMLRRMNLSHSAVTEWAIDFFDFHEDDIILDIGCGGGAALQRMSKYIKTGHLTGVDYSGVSVEMSMELNAADLRVGKMDILEASVEKLPFDDGIFDKVITVESFYFWPNPVENLKEVRRVLKKSGVFLLVADIYGKEGLKEETLKNIERYRLLNPTPNEFKEMLAQAGFGDIKIHIKSGEDWICAEAAG